MSMSVGGAGKGPDIGNTDGAIQSSKVTAPRTNDQLSNRTWHLPSGGDVLRATGNTIKGVAGSAGAALLGTLGGIDLQYAALGVQKGADLGSMSAMAIGGGGQLLAAAVVLGLTFNYQGVKDVCRRMSLTAMSRLPTIPEAFEREEGTRQIQLLKFKAASSTNADQEMADASASNRDESAEQGTNKAAVIGPEILSSASLPKRGMKRGRDESNPASATDLSKIESKPSSRSKPVAKKAKASTTKKVDAKKNSLPASAPLFTAKVVLKGKKKK